MPPIAGCCCPPDPLRQPIRPTTYTKKGGKGRKKQKKEIGVLTKPAPKPKVLPPLQARGIDEETLTAVAYVEGNEFPT